MTRLSGKTAVVTGAASGIGRATALRLVAEGATVVAGDIDADAGASLSREYKGKIFFQRTDVCLPDDIKALMDFAAQQMSGIDIVFNNAGAGGAPQRIDEMDVAGWDHTMNLLLRSVAMGIRFAVPHMLGRRGGSIVNTASVAALSTGMAPTAYSVAKAGVLHLSKVAAADLARYGIRVNAVCPGFIKTNIFTASLGVDGSMKERVNGMIAAAADQAQPVKRGGQPEDIAATVAFLASDDATFITGTHVLVDGGILIGPRHSWDPESPGMSEVIHKLIDASKAPG